jgi:hypothetical protein
MANYEPRCACRPGTRFDRAQQSSRAELGVRTSKHGKQIDNFGLVIWSQRRSDRYGRVCYSPDAILFWLGETHAHTPELRIIRFGAASVDASPPASLDLNRMVCAAVWGCSMKLSARY